MSLANVKRGDTPNKFNVIIEIPANCGTIKYEVDKDSSTLWVDRFMNVAMFYPCNYGFVPHTLSEDGDPVDVLVVTPVPVVSGSVIKCRPVGVLNMTDEAGPDAKIMAVPVTKLYAQYEEIQNVDDLPQVLLDQVKHFFEHYKALEKGKWVKVDGWADAAAAKQEIVASYERAQK